MGSCKQARDARELDASAASAARPRGPRRGTGQGLVTAQQGDPRRDAPGRSPETVQDLGPGLSRSVTARQGHAPGEEIWRRSRRMNLQGLFDTRTPRSSQWLPQSRSTGRASRASRRLRRTPSAGLPVLRDPKAGARGGDRAAVSRRGSQRVIQRRRARSLPISRIRARRDQRVRGRGPRDVAPWRRRRSAALPRDDGFLNPAEQRSVDLSIDARRGRLQSARRK